MSADKDVEKLKPSYSARGYVKWCSHFQNSLAVPPMIKRRVTYDPAIPLLGIDPREMKTYVHTKTCT